MIDALYQIYEILCQRLFHKLCGPFSVYNRTPRFTPQQTSTRWLLLGVDLCFRGDFDRHDIDGDACCDVRPGLQTSPPGGGTSRRKSSGNLPNNGGFHFRYSFLAGELCTCGVSRRIGAFLTGTGAFGGGPKLAISASCKPGKGVISVSRSVFRRKGGGGATGRRNSWSDKSRRFDDGGLVTLGDCCVGRGRVDDMTAGDDSEQSR